MSCPLDSMWITSNCAPAGWPMTCACRGWRDRGWCRSSLPRIAGVPSSTMSRNLLGAEGAPKGIRMTCGVPSRRSLLVNWESRMTCRVPGRHSLLVNWESRMTCRVPRRNHRCLETPVAVPTCLETRALRVWVMSKRSPPSSVNAIWRVLRGIRAHVATCLLAS